MKKKIEFLDLGQQPLANYYLDKSQINKIERKYKLIICFDNQSKLVSIKKTFSSKMMFNNKYPYRSSMSQTMQKSFKELARQIKKKINPKRILEIGSNDGSFLKNFNKKKKQLELNLVLMLNELLKRKNLTLSLNIGTQN